MTDEQKRIAIAEACPQIFVRPVGQSGWNYHSSIAGRILPCIDGDMLKDLNACHEMEKVLAGLNAWKYAQELWRVIQPDEMASYDSVKHVCATAAQRCEAFGRTLNLWKD